MFFVIIRDPIHKDIYLNDKEEKIIDTKEMQRLRYIKQLGATDFVYPGAVHSRFSHSIGTLHLTQKIIDILNSKNHNTIPTSDFLKIRIAALIHDVGHISYGHTFEDERPIFKHHDSKERFELFVNEKTELGKVLNDLKIKDEVTNILVGDPSGLSDKENLYKNIICDTICADFLDYIERDGYFCGLYLKYDPRVLNYFSSSPHLQWKLYLDFHDEKGRFRTDKTSDIMNLLRMRVYESERVIYHHTKVIVGAMISKAVEIAKEKYELTIKHLINLKDDELFIRLKFYNDRAIDWLIKSIRNRKILKRAYILPFIDSLDGFGTEKAFQMCKSFENRATLEKEIANEMNIETYKVIIACPKINLKEAEVNICYKNDLHKLCDLSKKDDLKGEPKMKQIQQIIEDYNQLRRFYVFVPKKNIGKAKQICERIFKHESIW